MLETLSVQGFKSFRDQVRLKLAPLTVIFGPNAAGKSNLIDALMLLSRLATSQKLADAISPPIRGYPLELFSLPPQGLPALLEQEPTFTFEADLVPESAHYKVRYRCHIGIQPRSGVLSVQDEYLAKLTKQGEVRGNAVIEKANGTLRVRRKSKPAHPWEEPIGLHYTLLSNRRYSGKEYETLQQTRETLAAFKSYYLDPRVAMREGQPPRDVDDIGPLGTDLGPFLYRLKAEHPKHFATVIRTLKQIIPGVDDILVELDEKRGLIDVEVVQEGTPFSIRIVSEGTLRVLALVCIAVNPWGGALIAFEEPENGVHPRRLELITELFSAFTLEGNPKRQAIVTTHSPLFCASVSRLAQRRPEEVKLYNAVHKRGRSQFIPFDPTGPLFTDAEIREGLSSITEDGIFEGLWLRGLLDD